MPLSEKLVSLRDFIIPRGGDSRERRTFDIKRGHVTWFRVQLEVKSGEEWKSVRRWDSSHGFVDCDSYNLAGQKRKEIYLHVSLEEGLTKAQEDMNDHWRSYRERFLHGGFP